MKVYSVILFSRNPHSTEIRQLIWNANKMADLYTIRIPMKRNFRIGFINPPMTHPLSQYNNNNNNNNNNKDLFASYIFTMALRAIEKKTIKTNKNVKIYQYIAVNTKNMTTNIVKGLR